MVPAQYAGMDPVLKAHMGQKVSGLEEFLAEFRPTLPARSRTAQAIDRQAPFAQIAHKAIADGHIEFADRLGSFLETCLRRSV